MKSVVCPAVAIFSLALSAPCARAQAGSAQPKRIFGDISASIALVEAQAGSVQPTPGSAPTTTAAPPTGVVAPAAAERPTLRLTLEDAVKLALDRNLDIAVQRLNPQTFDFSLASLESVYKPTLTSTLIVQQNTNASSSTISGNQVGTAIVQNIGNFNGGLAQNFRWGGGSLSVALNNQRSKTTSLTTLYNPSYTPNWSATYTQPLMRGFTIDSTRQQLLVTRLNQDISEIQLQASIINTLSNVRNAYWDYVFALQAVEVAKQSVSLAEQLVKDNQVRVEVGAMAPIDVVQAQSQAAAQRQALVAAQGTMRTAEITLKRLIVNGTQDPNFNATIDPIDRPDFRPEPIDLDAAIRRALSSRTDVAQAKKNLEVNNVTIKYLHNQVLPQADVVARYGLAGQGGTQLITQGSGITREVIGTIPGGFFSAVDSILRRDYPTWNVSFLVNYPVGTSSADAAIARAKVQLNEVEVQMRQIELQVATEVTNAAVQVQTNIERVEASQAAREFAQKQLEAENSKFEVGMSTNYLVVQSQRDLATAQNNELQSILSYRKSLVEMDRLQQTTLQNLNVVVVSSSATTASVGSGRGATGGGGS